MERTVVAGALCRTPLHSTFLLATCPPRRQLFSPPIAIAIATPFLLESRAPTWHLGTCGLPSSEGFRGSLFVFALHYR